MQSCALLSGLFKVDPACYSLVEPSNFPLPWSILLLCRIGLDIGLLDSLRFWGAVLGAGELCCAVLGSVGLYEAVQY